ISVKRLSSPPPHRLEGARARCLPEDADASCQLACEETRSEDFVLVFLDDPAALPGGVQFPDVRHSSIARLGWCSDHPAAAGRRARTEHLPPCPLFTFHYTRLSGQMQVSRVFPVAHHYPYWTGATPQ